MQTKIKSGTITVNAKDKIIRAKENKREVLKSRLMLNSLINLSDCIIVNKPIDNNKTLTAINGFIPTIKKGVSNHDNNGAQEPFIALLISRLIYLIAIVMYETPSGLIWY